MTIQLRRNTAAGAAGNNAVLALGEPGWDETNHALQIGDGVTHQQDLPRIAHATLPLVVDGTLVREGTFTGPVYKAVGYNTRSIPGIYTSAMTLDSQAKLDDFFKKQPPNSLHRMEAYAPGSGSGQTDASILAIIANTVATARKYGQRLILRTTNWTTVGSTPNVVDRFDNKSATWFTSQTYKHSVSGSTSYEDWIIALLGVCGTDGTVSIIDLCNEPSFSSGNAASVASYISYMSGVIKGIDSGKLVMLGGNVVGNMGGQSSYQTAIAPADICSAHNYNSYGFPTNTDPIITVSQTLGKPVIIDEHSQLSKGYYGLASDSDKDASGWPAVDSEAQGRELERFIASNLGISNCFGVLIYSWPGTQTDGLGHNEPPEGSLGRKVIREASLHGDAFSFESLPSISAWMDGAQNWRFAPKAAVTTWWYRHQNGGSVAVPSGNAPTAGRFGTHASFRFDGTKYIDQTPFKTGSVAATGCWALVPTIWPAAGAYMYLTGPQASTNLASGVRINSAGQVEVVKSATGGSVNGTVVCTSTNSVDRDAFNSLVWQWDPVGGTVGIYLNGTLTTATGQTASLTSGNARIGAGYDGLNGFVGHALEVIQETVYETAANIRLALAYFQRRYKSSHAVGVPIDLITQQIAGVSSGFAPLASPTFTGTPAAPTPALTDSSTKLATTAFVDGYAVPIPRFAFTSGDCWVLAGQSGTPSTLLLVEGREYAIPFYVPEAVTITTLAVEVTTASTAASTGVIRLGIRAHDSATGKPSTVLVDAGTVVSTSVAVVSATLGTPLALTPGWYWYSVVGQGAPATQATVRSVVAGSVLYPSPLRLASFAALGTAAQQLLFQNSQAGALGTFTSAGTLSGGPRLMAQAQ